MKLGIIGAGLIVRTFLPHLAEMENLEINAIMNAHSGEAERLAEAYGIPFVTRDFDAFMASDIDTVYVAVPNVLHFDYCMRILEYGKNIIVEKPMCSTYEEAYVLQKTAVEKHLFLFEAITTLYMPGYEKVREWLPRIGGVRIVEAEYSQYSSRYDDFVKGIIKPVFDPKQCGGALLDLNVYNIHYVMGLFGKPDSYRYFANIERDIDTGGMLILKYPEFVANCMAAKDCKDNVGGIIQGTKGVIRTLHQSNRIGKVILDLYDGTHEEYDDGFEAKREIPEFEAFVRMTETGAYEECYAVLQKSVDAAEVMTKARREAGVFFPADGYAAEILKKADI